MNVAEIEMQLSDLVNDSFDPSEFIFRFIEIFQPPKATLTKLRKSWLATDSELLWARKLYYRVAESGQSANVVDVLCKQKIAKNKAPRFIISSDGKEFSALDTKIDETLHCDFKNLNDHFDFFFPLAGIARYNAIDENPADIKAAGRLAKFHDEIIRNNPDWHTPEKRHALNQFMTRILFCLFSEDTGSFTKQLFIKTITEFGGDDGEHLQSLLQQIFDVMNVSEDQRGDIPAHVNAFPYVNGGLFAEQTEVPAFRKRTKRVLIEAAGLDWREINPDIFGSMIQAVVDDSMRGDLGMHYTSVPNIMKVLQPLFLMSLEEGFANAHGHREERAMLKRLLSRISKIRVFDPACGSGNFLIIAYRELRSLEMRIFQREDSFKGGQFSQRWESNVKLSNFYGIELADFAAETAKLSLWIAEYQMNQRFKSLFGEAPADFPLKEGGHIQHGNALHLDWFEVCPSSDDGEVETYIVGNPPYLGSTWQDSNQKGDMEIVFSPFTKKFKNLDYVAAWYLKGAEYCKDQIAEYAFVATNSICQGEQVALLWPLIFDLGMEISFAHQSFKWKNLAAQNAGVTCVIVGIRMIAKGKKILFNGEIARQVIHIGPYLIEMPNIIIHKASKPLNSLPPMEYGNKPVDGGNLILSLQEKETLQEKYPEAEQILRKFYGSQELIKGIERWCLWIKDEKLKLALSIPPIAERIEKVRIMRLNSTKLATREAAKTSYQFGEVRDTNSEHTIIIPRVSSENRPYLPVDLLTDGSIIQDRAFAIYDGPAWVLAIIASRLHQQWIATVCVRLETRISYSNTLGYNTFPISLLSDKNKEALEIHAWEILAIRETHPGKTISWLYDSNTMPDNLLVAHKALDDTLEKIYIGRPFKDDTERLEHLFKRYAEMTSKGNT
jgi:hypothetical protein